MSEDVNVHSEECTNNYLTAAKAYAADFLSVKGEAVETQFNELLKDKDYKGAFEFLEKLALESKFLNYEFWRLMEITADSMDLPEPSGRCKAKMHESIPAEKNQKA